MVCFFAPEGNLYNVNITFFMKPVLWIFSGFLSGQLVFWVSLAAPVIWKAFRLPVDKS